ncbi:hypothetical protein [Mycoplasma sp. Sp33II]|uniref:hypothetical protein n=1 Tax=unclassified Mycoplasma TaxID=2683645 RepID=UPI003AAEF3BB
MEKDLKLFEIYQINDRLENLLSKENNIETYFTLPIFISGSEVLFCQVKKKHTFNNKLANCKELTIYTNDQISDYVVEFKTIYKIPIEIFQQNFKNINSQMLGGCIAESNELELFDAFVQSLEQTLYNSKLISINIKPNSNNNCY